MKQRDYDPHYYGSLNGEDAVKFRLGGALPMLDIAGQLFFVDVRIMQLRPKDNFLATPIDLNDVGYFDGTGRHYLMLYDKKKKEEAFLPSSTKTVPQQQNLVVVKFPTLYALDPIAVARMNGKDERSYLREYPMKMYQKAEVLPLTRDLIFTITGTMLAEPEKRKERRVQSPPANNKSQKK
jgi:hypothetical protein